MRRPAKRRSGGDAHRTAIAPSFPEIRGSIRARRPVRDRDHADVAFGRRAGWRQAARRAGPCSRASSTGSTSRPRNWVSTVKDTGKGVENFGHEAGVAAKTTVDSAKDAADAVARIPAGPASSPVTSSAQNAPNGAPDCISAANAICKGKGFDSGKSLDMTTRRGLPLPGSAGGPEQRAGMPRRDVRFPRALPIALPPFWRFGPESAISGRQRPCR